MCDCTAVSVTVYFLSMTALFSATFRESSARDPLDFFKGRNIHTNKSKKEWMLYLEKMMEKIFSQFFKNDIVCTNRLRNVHVELKDIEKLLPRGVPMFVGLSEGHRAWISNDVVLRSKKNISCVRWNNVFDHKSQGHNLQKNKSTKRVWPFSVISYWTSLKSFYALAKTSLAFWSLPEEDSLTNKQAMMEHAVRSKDIQVFSILYKIALPKRNKLWNVAHMHTFSFIFNLHSSLAFKVLFLELNIGKVLGFCPHNVTIFGRTGHVFQSIFSYCGCLANFTVYPSQSRFKFQIYIGRMWYLKLVTVFDLLSRNGIYSCQTVSNKSVQQPLIIHFLPSSENYVIVFYLRVKKFQIMVFNLTLYLGRFCVFHDGPDDTSQGKIIASNVSNVTSTTFQSVWWFLSPSNEPVDFSFPFSLSYACLVLREHSQLLVTTNRTLQKQYSCNTSDTHYIFDVIKSPQNSSIKVKISHFVLHGIYTSDCQFGGLSFFDNFSFGPNEIVSHCSPAKFNYFQDTISDTNLLKILVYSYKSRSSLDVMLNLSITWCQITKVKVCELEVLCLSKMLKHPKHKFKRPIGFSCRKRRANQVRNEWKLKKPETLMIKPKQQVCSIVQLFGDSQIFVERNQQDSRIFFGQNLLCTLRLDIRSKFTFLHTVHGYFPVWSAFAKIGKITKTIQESATFYKETSAHHSHRKAKFYSEFCTGRDQIEIRRRDASRGFMFLSILFQYHLHRSNQRHYQMMFSVETEQNLIPWVDITFTPLQDFTHNAQGHIVGRGTPYTQVAIWRWSESFLKLTFHQTSNQKSPTVAQINASNVATYHSEEVQYHKTKYTVDQLVIWSYNFNVENTSVFMGLPGVLHNLSVHLLSGDSGIIHYKWFVLTKGLFKSDLLCDATKNGLFSNVEHKLKVYCKSTSLHDYHFIKYVDKYTFSHCECYQTERQSMLFSWKKSYELCQRRGGNLPEFLTKATQDDLLLVMKISADIFPLEALFIGLIKHSKKVYIFAVGWSKCVILLG